MCEPRKGYYFAPRYDIQLNDISLKRVFYFNGLGKQARYWDIPVRVHTMKSILILHITIRYQRG